VKTRNCVQSVARRYVVREIEFKCLRRYVFDSDQKKTRRRRLRFGNNYGIRTRRYASRRPTERTTIAKRYRQTVHENFENTRVVIAAYSSLFGNLVTINRRCLLYFTTVVILRVIHISFSYSFKSVLIYIYIYIAIMLSFIIITHRGQRYDS